jgi:rod shape-determining protein MreC
MDNIFTGRHKNLTILAIVLTVQFFGLAAQIRRPTDQGTATPLIRTWVVTGITPIEKFFVHTATGVRDTFGSYFYLRGVRKENASLRQQVEQMRLEQVRLQEDAAQGRRLQSLLGFKEQFISETLPAQVIGTSGSDASRVIFIDKGTSDGVKDNMAVITPNGVVGKVAKAFHGSSQVLLISDQSWGAGGILVQSRLQGIVKGTQAGAVQMTYIMSDNQIKPGEQIVTSGGDRIFPKGLPLGTVKEVAPGKDMFLNIRVTPAADLNRVEEVLVITKVVEKAPDGTEISGPIRASDILAQRLPSVPQKSAEDGTNGSPAASPAPTNPGTSVVPPKTANSNSTTKPSTGAPAPAPATTKPATGAAPPKITTPKENKPANAAPQGN